ncbi:MAG: glutamine amidotransferase, partial [Actinobacteria bacterium]
GLIDAVTESGDGRIVGRVRGSIRRPDLTTRLIGFENHAGRTWVGPGATPLARVARGRGNNGTDRTEGAVQGRVVGTYLHGPVLALNPAFADWLLALALGRERVDPLDDEAERHARAAWPRGRKR